ncbi:hypothetical protein EV177_000874 [Coemansia sp. RSA 1804]|nr:hypothetical protein EV177_000874 [Coemansia sp. RSA 1804]
MKLISALLTLAFAFMRFANAQHDCGEGSSISSAEPTSIEDAKQFGEVFNKRESPLDSDDFAVALPKTICTILGLLILVVLSAILYTSRNQERNKGYAPAKEEET